MEMMSENYNPFLYKILGQHSHKVAGIKMAPNRIYFIFPAEFYQVKNMSDVIHGSNPG
jgi:hypothetical protein